MSHQTNAAIIAVGFGDNYFSQMGSATPKVSLPQQAVDTSDDDDYTYNVTSSTAAPPPLGVVTSYQLSSTSKSRPPWEQQQQDNDDDDELMDVSCTVTASYFLTRRGRIWTVGTLHGMVHGSLTRTVVTLPLRCVQIATGRHFCLARMEGGLAVCAWGAGHFGQLGLGPESPPFVDRPTVVESLLPHIVGSPVTSVRCGYWHSLASTQAGRVFAWGCNRNSQCGFRPTKEPPTVCSPQPVSFDHITTSSTNRIEKIAAGRSHSVVLDENGQVYTFGANHYAQCGVMTRRKGGVAPAKHVEALIKVRIVDIAAGDAHTIALTGGGRVFCWGGGFEGQLGTGMIVMLNPKPKLVGDLDFVAIEAGREWKHQQHDQHPNTNKTVQDDNNDEGGGGDGGPKGTASTDATVTSSMTGSETLANIPKIVSVAAKGNSSFAVSSAGRVYAWGCNDKGNLGVPKPDPATLTYVDPGMAQSKMSTLRQCHTYSFDSSHNVALPQRIDALRDLHVTAVAAAPTFLWCLGIKRQETEDPNVGRTLYEVQEARRINSLQQHSRNHPHGFGRPSLKTTNPLDTVSSSDIETTNDPTESSASPQVEKQQQHPVPVDPPGIKSESQVDGVGPLPLPLHLGNDGAGDDDDDDDRTSEGSTSQHSQSAAGGTTTATATTTSATTTAVPPNDIPISPVTPSKKKRLFSPKKLVKAIVRRASGAPKPKAEPTRPPLGKKSEHDKK